MQNANEYSPHEEPHTRNRKHPPKDQRTHNHPPRKKALCLTQKPPGWHAIGKNSVQK